MTQSGSSLSELDDNALSAEFLQAWEALREGLSALHDALAAETDRPAWAWRSNNPHRAAADIVSRVFYDDDQPAREVHMQPALVGASEECLRLTQMTNARRLRVKRALMALDRRVHRAVNPLTGRQRRKRLGDVVLEQHGLARLHRVQVYRSLHVLDERPETVGFVWAQTRRVQRISVEALRERIRGLLKNPPQAEFARKDLDLLTSLRAQEWLALVEAQPMHVRANVTWRRADGSGYIRRMTSATLPLLYPAKAGEPLPRLKPLPQEPTPRGRTARTDRKLETEPFLSTLQVYRYRRR